MEFKFTKGKWFSSGNYVGLENHPTRIAYINGSKSAYEDEANALLISKAPEMLEMLNDNLLILNNTLSYLKNIEIYVPSFDVVKFKTNKMLIERKIIAIELLIKEATEFK